MRTSIIFISVFLILSISCSALVVPDYENNATVIDRDYILGTGLIFYNFLPYMFTGLGDLVPKFLTGTSISDNILGRTIDASIMGVPLSVSENEYKVYEAIEPFVGEKINLKTNMSQSNLDDGVDGFLLSYYDSKSKLLSNINLMFNYIISLFIVLAEVVALLIQLAIFSVAVLVFIELLPNMLVFIKEKYRDTLYSKKRSK